MENAAAVLDPSYAPPPPCEEAAGLTAAEVRARLEQFGPNAVREEKAHPLRSS